MFGKDVLSFCLYVFLIGTLPCEMGPDINIEQNLTEADYNALKGPDLCGALACDTETQKKACTKVAVREKLINCGENLEFLEGYPACFDVKIQLYKCDGKQTCHKDKTVDGKVLDCSNKKKGFPIGKGLNANDLIMYKCLDGATCNAYYSMPDVFSN